MQSQDLEAFLVDVVVLAIDLPVAAYHLLGQFRRARLQGAHGLVDSCLDGAGHVQKVALQDLKVLLQVLGHHCPLFREPPPLDRRSTDGLPPS
jgi:hypothetical protein